VPLPRDSDAQQPCFEGVVDEAHSGDRLDVYLAAQLEETSRSFVKKLVKDGSVTINGQAAKRPSRTMATGDTVTAEIPPPPSTEIEPEDIPLDILYEDAEVLVVNKASGMVVHPAPGHYSGTLVHAVLHHCPDLQRSGMDPDRPGIVHRLDRFTSGTMVVAKTPGALRSLSEQAREHTFERRYRALARGRFKEKTGRIVASVGRSINDRSRMTVTGVNCRDAVTRFEVLECFALASLVELRLETGRTHQIRVHLRFVGHQILGDPVYGVTDFSGWPITDVARAALEALEGQALHAEVLGFTHPASGERMRFSAAAPPDFQAALATLRQGAPHE
jgi:23S rRNA pseudouridine1911/1915/1917 synthase